MSRTRATPRLAFRDEEEKALYDGFIDEIFSEYESLLPSDKRQVAMAATEYILAIRLQQDEMTTGRVHLNSRYSHLQQCRAILNDLALSRSARLKEKPASSSNEGEELRNILFDLGRMPTTPQRN